LKQYFISGRQFTFLFLIVLLFPSLTLSNTDTCIISFLPPTASSEAPAPADSVYFLVTASQFFVAFDLNKDPRFHKSRTKEEFLQLSDKGSRFFLNFKQNAGYAITGEGELISIFNASGRVGLGADAVLHSIQNGARFLHCLEPLSTYFSRFGFVVDTSAVSQALDANRQNIWSQVGAIPQRMRMVLKSHTD
jgi:hypothetical protein